jgi:toxin ParE1/3/4
VNRFSLRPEAIADLDGIEDYIAQDDVEQALAFTERLYEKLSLIATQPAMGRPRPELGATIRSFPVGPYIVFYEPVATGIDIVRVLRGSRDIDPLF